ncbi:MAG: EndoU domain-containing protein [Alphaproteobacteria bacterium]|nr:EndoU domain-containing protein [Alphaproteobacteria bacterium]
MSIKKIIRNKKILVPMIVALLGYAGFTVSQSQVSEVVDMVAPAEVQVEAEAESTQHIQEEFNEASLITPARRAHILYGDATGGGHLYGVGAPCKSEFPKHWDEDTIIKEVSLIAANDNLNWQQERNGYHVTEQNVGTVKVRVVKDEDNAKVITAYPVNLGRNPCPSQKLEKPSNDN